MKRNKSSSSSFLPTGLTVLDFALKGGLQCGKVTEIVGTEQSGKTQFCITMIIQALTTWPGHVLYIDTTKSFDPARLATMAKARAPQMYNSEQALTLLLKRVTVLSPNTISSLNEQYVVFQVNLTHHINLIVKLNMLTVVSGCFLQKKNRIHNAEFQNMLIKNNVRIIILDTVASVRNEFDKNIIAKRQEMLSHFSSKLKNLAEQLNLCILVTNSVTYSTNEAALGWVWGHCVNTRLTIQAAKKQSSSGFGYGNYNQQHLQNQHAQQNQQMQRDIIITKSPIAPIQIIHCEITEAGITSKEVAKVQQQQQHNETRRVIHEVVEQMSQLDTVDNEDPGDAIVAEDPMQQNEVLVPFGNKQARRRAAADDDENDEAQAAHEEEEEQAPNAKRARSAADDHEEYAINNDDDLDDIDVEQIERDYMAKKNK